MDLLLSLVKILKLPLLELQKKTSHMHLYKLNNNKPNPKVKKKTKKKHHIQTIANQIYIKLDLQAIKT